MLPPAIAGLTAVLVSAALLAAHHLGDYWLQTHHQATHKGDHTRIGKWMCLKHVLVYTSATSAAVLLVLHLPLGAHASPAGIVAGQVFSAVTHYALDRRWTVQRLAGWTGKRDYHDLGKPRSYRVTAQKVVLRPAEPHGTYHEHIETVVVPLDALSAHTGANSLDQAAHWVVLFIAALLTALI